MTSVECVIHYTGSLKKDTDIHSLFEKIKTQLEDIPCSIDMIENEMFIRFNTMKSDPFKFRFDKRKLDEKFQWNSDNKIVNEKHRQIIIYFNQQYTFDEQWDLSTYNDGSKEISILLSVLNYLGFEYRGITNHIK